MYPEKPTILFRAALNVKFYHVTSNCSHNDSNVHKISVAAKEAHKKDVSETAIIEIDLTRRF